MKLNAVLEKHFLKFKKPAGTSRGWLTEKPCWFIKIKDESTGITGIGEASIIPHLSIDDRTDYESKLIEVCTAINESEKVDYSSLALTEFPSIQFAIEMALLDLKNGGKQIYFENEFSRAKKGILINGLIWMGSYDEMWKQVIEKVNAGYNVIKLKIGALDFDGEVKLLKKIREHYPEITLRLDANGAFSPAEALDKLITLSGLNIHSIEQPIKQGQWEIMKDICSKSPIPIALDEELIGVNSPEEKIKLLDTISPQYIILKPSLIGGFAASDEWIKLAEMRNIGWWITSALESNIGLNAIAQWTASKNIIMAQGLGTGSLFENNIESDLHIENGELYLSTK